MSNINTLAQAIETATLSVSREKGLASAKQWATVMVAVLASYPNAIENLNSWIAGGVSASTSSGVAYKARHNKGVFPSEQVFCNTRGKARRSLNVVCKAIATALIDNVAYNPDRFRNTLTMDGLEQGLTQFNIAPERVEKATISQSLAGLKLNKADKQTIVKANEELVETVDKGSLSSGSELKRDHTAKALEVSATIEAIIAKYAKPTKPATVKKGKKEITDNADTIFDALPESAKIAIVAESSRKCLEENRKARNA